jgi:ATP-dependent DNA helicase RecQ
MMAPPLKPRAVVSIPLGDKPPVPERVLPDFDPVLAEYLREWRRTLARERKIPAYIILHDSVLEELCRRRPASFRELQQITGIGERKAEVYGTEILQALRNFGQGARAAPTSSKEPSPAEQTLRLLNEGLSFEEIARTRARQVSTIVCTVANLIEAGLVKLDPKWVSPDAQPQIEAACLQYGVEKLKTVKDALPPFVSYEDIRLVVAHLRAEHRVRARSA